MLNNEEFLAMMPDGTMGHVKISVQPRMLTQEIIKTFASKAVRKVHNAFPTRSGSPATIHLAGNEVFVSCYLYKINIRTSFQLGSDKLLRPVFLDKNTPDDKKEKLLMMNGEWAPPETMRVMFAARIKEWGSTRPRSHHDHGCFLIAWDALNRARRLPLPNLYDTLALCTGQFDGSSSNLAGAFDLALEQFENSEWNQDLFTDDRSRGANELMKFRATEGGMESVEFDHTWEYYCPIQSTSVIEILNPAIKAS